MRLVHASLPQTVLNPYNGDDHEHIHTATAETCAAVAEQLGVDVESLGYVIKAVALAATGDPKEIIKTIDAGLDAFLSVRDIAEM